MGLSGTARTRLDNQRRCIRAEPAVGGDERVENKIKKMVSGKAKSAKKCKMVMLRNVFFYRNLWKLYAPEQKFRAENGGLFCGTYPICIHMEVPPPPPGGVAKCSSQQFMILAGVVFRISTLFLAASWVLSLSLASFFTLLKSSWLLFFACAISISHTSVSRGFFFHFWTSYLTFMLCLSYSILFSGDGLFIRMILDFLLSLQAFLTSSGRPLTWFVLLIATTSVILLAVSLNFVQRFSTSVSSSYRRGSKAPPIFVLNSSAMVELLSRLTSELFGRLFSRLALVPCRLTFWLVLDCDLIQCQLSSMICSSGRCLRCLAGW